MSRAFVEEVPERIVFGVGAEARVADELVACGAERVLLLALERHRAGADRIAAALGARCAGVHTALRQHVPEAQAEAARAVARSLRADWVVAHGGGTPIGFAKAIALTEPVKVAAVPTTYAGSERTNIWGLTTAEGKRTGRDDRVRPALVVYDPALTAGLPRDLTLHSLYNALAHSVEALYDATAPAAVRARAEASVAPLIEGIRTLAADPADLEGRSEALYGAYLAASALDGATMGLHHKLAHVLGGLFDTPHATTHALLLPYVLGFNGRAAPDAMARLRPVLGEDPPAALYDLSRDLGVPIRLSALGLTRDDLEAVVEAALARPYANPRPVTAVDLRRLLWDAWHERRPSLSGWRMPLDAPGPHGGIELGLRGAPLEDARVAVICVHGRGAAAERILRDVSDRAGPQEDVVFVAPQASDNVWYPKGFTAPIDENQPWLDSALAVLDAVWARVARHLPPERIVLVGFSQGACLSLTWLKRGGGRPSALLAWAGAALDLPGDWPVAGQAVYLSKSAGDPYIPPERFEQTRAALTAAGARLSVHVEPGDAHWIYDADADALRRAIAEARR